MGLTYLSYRLIFWLIAKREEKEAKNRSRSPEEPGGPDSDNLVAEEEQRARSTDALSNAPQECQKCRKIELIGFIAFFCVFILLVIYFAAAEQATFGDCLFYAFFAIFAGSFRIEYFESSILLFFLTFCGIISLFLTMSLIVKEFSKSVNILQRVLSQEAKNFVEAKKKTAEAKFPEIYSQAIETHINCYCHRLFLPLFRYYFHDEFFQNLRQYQEVANLHHHYHSLLSQAAEDQRPSRKRSTTTSITNLALTLNVASNTEPPKPKHTAHFTTQTPHVVTVDSDTEVHPLVQDFSCHVGPTHETRGDLAVVEIEDVSLQTEPDGKHVAVQHPEPRAPAQTTTRSGGTAARGGATARPTSTARPGSSTPAGTRRGGTVGGSARGMRR